jgi:hypothetical protein
MSCVTTTEQILIWESGSTSHYDDLIPTAVGLALGLLVHVCVHEEFQQVCLLYQIVLLLCFVLCVC